MTESNVPTTPAVWTMAPSWLGLRDAAILVGRRVFGDTWTDAALDDSARVRQLRKALYAAFQSGDVEVLLTEYEGDAPITLKGEHSNHPEFTIKMDTWQIWLGQLPGFAFNPSVKRSDLQNFLNGIEPIPKEEQALSWLVNLMSAGPKIHPKGVYERQAYTQFNVGAGTFESVWAQAKKASGVEGWDRPGRPRKSS